MDKLKLKKHIPNKARLKRIDARISELCETEPAGEVMGKVRGSSKDFPYTEVRTSVMIPDPDEQERINKQIRKKEAERLQVVAEIQEVEEFLDGIGDVEIKEIFELVYEKGLSQTKAGKQIGYSQGRISQIIDEYLKD
nr:MAG TPA: HTH-type transcriptional regulator [Caudoviricetes sp.]